MPPPPRRYNVSCTQHFKTSRGRSGTGTGPVPPPAPTDSAARRRGPSRGSSSDVNKVSGRHLSSVKVRHPHTPLEVQSRPKTRCWSPGAGKSPLTNRRRGDHVQRTLLDEKSCVCSRGLEHLPSFDPLLSATRSPVAPRTRPATGRTRTSLRPSPRAPPTPEPSGALRSPTAQRRRVSPWTPLTSCQQRLLSGAWRRSAASSPRFKVGERSRARLLFTSVRANGLFFFLF